MKKFLALLMTMIFVVTGLVACGDGESKENKEGTSSVSGDWVDMFGEEYVKAREEYEAEHNPYDIPEELVGTTVKFATWVDHTTTESGPVIEKFEKETGINVEWVQIPQDTYFAQLSQMVAAGEAPDVYVENNEFFPLTLQISKPLDEVKSIDLNDPIWDTGYSDFTTLGEHYYQLNAKNSVWQTSHVIFYNKKAFEENGLMTPQDYIDAGEWTLENMMNIMREFNALGENYSGGMISPEILGSSLGTSIMYMQDGKFVSGLKSPELLKAYQTYHQTLSEGISTGTGIHNVIKGTIGVYPVDSYGLKATGYFKGVAEDLLGFAPFPEVEGEEHYTPAHYRAYGIVSGSKNAEAAGYFLRYFLDPYNYDWDSTFISEDAKDYYVEYIAGEDFSNKRFSFDTCGASLLGYQGQDGMRTWRQKLCWAAEAQLATTMESISGEVNTAIEKANQILDEIAAK